MSSVTPQRAALAGALLATVLAARPAHHRHVASAVDPRLYAGLAWRSLGPFRGGRITAVSGAVGQPGVFYAGLPAGGIIKTTSAGESWLPVFDGVTAVSSVGSIEVAMSDPAVVYAGTGDLLQNVNMGNGVYRSGDAGRTWRHVGLDSSRQVPSMVVDPRDANVVLAAALGNPYVRSETRGVFRTTDGGATWTRTLALGDSVGVQKLARAADAPAVVFALSFPYFGPPPSASGAATPPVPTAVSLFKSGDGGLTWREVTGGGLPKLAGRTSIAVATGTGAQRVYLVNNAGLHRSDDGGASWRQVASDDDRIHNGQGGYNCGVYVDPRNPDVVYVISTSSYRSVDGGLTFTGFKGAPGGDDPQQLWIDPTNGQRMLMGLDQGATVTLDGGATWSSWYNQSFEQLYHLSTDASSPYWVYATQQDAGAIRTRARGHLGAVTPFDWNPVPGWEWGTIVADPLDPATVYSSGSGILRIAYPSEQWINVSPAADPALKLRTSLSQPIAFAPWNRRLLLAAFQSVMSTTDRGAHWTAISGDLTVAPAGMVDSTPRTRAIESMGLSTLAAGTIWVGTTNGLIKVTRNAGRTWEEASVPGIPIRSRAEVLAVEPSRHDAATAYAAISLQRVGDFTPYLFRTRDYGRTWTRIVNGLPTGQASGSFVRVVRSDPKKPGLLFAGTESGVFVSFDDGDLWQPLSQNLPTTSVRDIAMHDDDLLIATYGRGLWVLDDYSMLRQLAPSVAAEPAHLFAPASAVRLRRNVNADTPLPPEVPHAVNPPDGVVLDYWLAEPARDGVTIDVFDASGAVVRHLSSATVPPVAEAARPPHPGFWLAAPAPLATTAGTHRVNWDLRHDAPPAFRHSYEINANPGLTPPSPEGPLAPPGTYTLRLTANGHRSEQAVVVRPDPHSPADASAIGAQHALLMRIVQGMRASYEGQRVAVALAAALRGAAPADTGAGMAALSARAALLTARLDTVAGLDAARARARTTTPPPPNFTAINNALVAQLNAQDAGDMAPTSATLAAFTATCRELTTVAAAWDAVRSRELAEFNALLADRRRTPLARPASLVVPGC